MTEKELLKLKKKMPKGYREKLAEKFGITISYVDKIFSGDKTRSDVIDEAIELATEHKLKLANQKTKIKQL